MKKLHLLAIIRLYLFRLHRLSDRFPRLSGKEMVKLFIKHGWQLVRVTGSHHVFKHPDGRAASIPVHGNKTLQSGIAKALIRKSLKLSDKELADL